MMLGLATVSPYFSSGGIPRQTITPAKIKSRIRKFESSLQVKLTLQMIGMSQVDSLAQKHKESNSDWYHMGMSQSALLNPRDTGSFLTQRTNLLLRQARLVTPSFFGLTSHLIVCSELHKIFSNQPV